MKTVIRTALTFTVACLAFVAVTAAAPGPEGLTTPAEVALDASVAEAASPACDTAGLLAFGPHSAPLADAAVTDRKQCWRWIWQDPTHCCFCAFGCKGAGYRCCTPDPL